MYCVAFVDRQMIAFLVAPIRADLGITDFQLSLLHGFGFVLFYTIFGLPLGYLVDRISRRGIIYVSMTIWSIAAAGCGIAKDFSHFLIARMMVGAGEAGLNPSAYSMISDAFAKRGMTVAMTIYGAGASVGAALSVALIGHLIRVLTAQGVVNVPFLGETAPWRVVFLIVGTPGIVLAFLCWTMTEPKRQGRMSETQPPLSAVVDFMKSRKRYFICCFVGYAMVQFCSFAFFSWMPTFMMRHHHWDIAQVATFAGLATLCSIPFAMAVGWVVQRLFEKGYTDVHVSSYAVILPVSCLNLIVALTLVENPYVAVSMFAVSIGLNAYVGVASAGVQIVSPNEFRGQLSVIFLLVMNMIGAGIGSSVPAAFTDFVFKDDAMVGWSIALTLAIFGPVTSAILWAGRGATRRAVEDAKAWSGK
jgi:MFS family permease